MNVPNNQQLVSLYIEEEEIEKDDEEIEKEGE